MNKSSELLHQLIRSLTKEEKRHFKLFARSISGKNQSNYVRLFDEIAKQKTYDEAKLKQKFAGQVFIKQLSVTKHYLYQLILKSLQHLHSKNNVENRILDGIKQARILLEKRVFNVAKDILKKTKKLAIEHKKVMYFPLIYELLFAIQNVHFSYADFKDHDEFAKLKEEAILGADQMRNLMDFLIAHAEFCFFSRKVSYNQKMEAELTHIMQKPIFQNEELALSLDAKALYYNLHGIYNMVKQNGQKALECFLKQLSLLERPDLPIKERQHNYVVALGNAIICTPFLYDWKTLKTLLKKREDIRSQNVSELAMLRLNHCAYSAELRMYTLTGDIENGMSKIQEIEDFMNSPQNNMTNPAQMTFKLFIALLYFTAERYDETIDLIEEILDNDADIFPTIRDVAKVLRLIIYYERDELLVLPYAIRSAYRKFQRSDTLFEFERVLLNFLKRITNINSNSKIKKEFHKFKHVTLEKLSEKERPDKTFLSYFDYFAWIDSKIEGCSFREALKKNLNMKSASPE